MRSSVRSGPRPARRPSGGPATHPRSVAALAAALSLAAASPAVAHVDVFPTTAEIETAQEFTARVPSERSLATTRVEIRFPAQVTVYAFTPVPGWKRTVRTAADGTVTGVVYSGGRIEAGEYQDFTFLGTPFGDGTAAWEALQTYADGKVKPWTGPPEEPGAESQETGPTAPGPAAATRIVAKGALASAAAPAGGGDDSSPAGIWLGVIAIAFALGALVATGFLWSTRPMTLPGEPEPGPGAPKRAGKASASSRRGGRG